MAEETLSQAAIDALLSGNNSPETEKPAEPPKQEAPSPPEPEPIPPPPPEPEPVAEVVSEPAPESTPEPVVAPEPAPEQTPEPVASPEPVPEQTPEPAVAPGPAPTAQATPSPMPAATPDEMANLVSRIQKAEQSLASVNTQAGTGTEITNRLEALEASVLQICQIQQQDHTDPALEKIPKLEQQLATKMPELERELATMSAAVKDLSDQLQVALNQMKETSREINSVMKGIKGTWGYDIHDSYECQHCGAKGNIVGLVKCSECGDEDWWGWWPPEYEEDHEPYKSSTRK